MKRHPPIPNALIESRLQVDLVEGKCYWLDATKHHKELVGQEAGFAMKNHSGKYYWIIKIDGIPYKRSQLVLALASGQWPTDTVDHIDGNSLNDKAENLRHATVTQNAWNHKTRKKSENTPMGVRALPSGRFQARIACDKKQITLGVFDSVEAASAAYQAGRKEHFHAFC